MNTAQHRNAAHDARELGDYKKAAHHYRQALALYPPDLLAQNSALVAADTDNLAQLANRCAELADHNANTASI